MDHPVTSDGLSGGRILLGYFRGVDEDLGCESSGRVQVVRVHEVLELGEAIVSLEGVAICEATVGQVSVPHESLGIVRE